MSTVPPSDPAPALQSWWSRLLSTAQAVLAGVISLGTSLGEAFARNLFAVPAGILAFIFLFVLPQSRNLLWQLPALGGLSMAEFVLSVLLIAYLFALLAIYLVLCFCLIPRQHVPTLGNPGIFARFATFRDRVESRIDAIVDFAASTRSRRISRHGSLLIVLAAGIMLITWYFDRSLPTWWRVSGSTYSTLLALTGFWLLFCPAGGVLGFKLRLTGRALVLFLVTNLVGQFLWMLPEQLPDYFSPRVFTIWAIIQISFLLVTTARVIDACHYASAWNIRALVVAGSLLGFLSMQSQQVGHFWRLPPRPEDRAKKTKFTSTTSTMPGPSAQAGVAATQPKSVATDRSPTLSMDETVLDLWFRAWESAINRTDPTQPLVFVSASGGGARAAMFTALVLEAMRHTPLPGTRPDSSAELDAQRPKSLADQIVLISGVSGGSLATGYYVAQSFPHMRVQRDRASAIDDQLPRLVPKGDRTRYAWRNAFPNDLYARMHQRSLLMLDETRSGRGRDVSMWAGTRFEQAVERVAQECDQLTKGGGAGGKSQPIAPWLATSAFVDDMSTDFTAPLLRGILNPGLERGVSVTRFWESQFGWRDVDDVDLHRQPHPDDPTLGVVTNGAPVVMFNTCDVVQGSRIVLGFPPVPPGLIRDPLAKPTSHLAYSLTDRGDLYYHLSLAEAVRLSANFPFGFEVGKLQLSRGDDTVLALDGGIVDNSGIDSIVSMFQGLSRQADAYYRDWGAFHTRFGQAKTDDQRSEIRREFNQLTCDSIQGKSYRLLNLIASRKVVLVQIDSGTKEIQTQNSDVSKIIAGLSPVVFRPFQALNNASYTNAEQAIELYDGELSKLWLRPAMPQCDCDFDSVAPAMEAPVAPAPQAPAIPSPFPSIPRPPILPLQSPPLIERVRLTCNQSANIMTAWTLGPDDKAQVLVQFLIEWTHQERVLKQAMEIQKRIGFTDAWTGYPTRKSNDELAKRYAVFQRGQRLVDRARSEFYQSLAVPEASRVHTFPQSSPALDEYSKDDIREYDRLFDQRIPTNPSDSAVLPAAPSPSYSNTPLPAAPIAPAPPPPRNSQFPAPSAPAAPLAPPAPPIEPRA